MADHEMLHHKSEEKKK